MILNPGFEDAGVTQGSAMSWTSSSLGTYEEIATFGEGAETAPWESFEGSWLNDSYAFALPGASPRALFGPPANPLLQDGFEHGWFGGLLDLYFFTLVNTIEGIFQSPLKPETFEAGWLNVPPYLTAFAPADLSAGPAEDFEAGWLNTPYQFTLGASTAALFGLGPSNVEGFEDVYLPRAVLVDPTLDEVRATSAFSLPLGAIVYFLDTDAAQLPSPLESAQTYYVSVIVNATTIRVSESPGLVPNVDIASFGIGTNYLVRDPAGYWSDAPVLPCYGATMASGDWTDLTNSLSTGSLARGVTSGITPPNGGGSFVFGFNSKNTDLGAAGKFTNQVNFAPMAKGGSVRGAVQRGISGGPVNFSPLLFAALQGADIGDVGYLLGLSDEDPHKIVLRKGKLSDGIPAGLVGTLGILRKSTAGFTPGTWVHIRLDVVVNLNGDVILQCFENDLLANPVTAPVWVAIPGMASFTDDALGINSGSAPYTSGRAGFAMSTKDVTRRTAFDSIEVFRQL